ncbi:TIGR01777 family oxidoreductase [Shewanella atlantica]|uniref:TIGR01777 family protein n=1 Tax=Shewanella atlantica TaxID=271099 RepID=A0A431WF66_9GAMM|nr:TIGR01777 family oxidoreductase [Shewanella atlantica]RTR34186.1 TIGR01777 family protein [Shewanella atlantica]
MNILITGASGFIGHQLVRALESKHQLSLLSRHPARAREKLGSQHQYLASLDSLSSLDEFDAVINLAGEPIAGKRWSIEQKQLICDSRWNITARLSELIARSQTPPWAFISASAIGRYGQQGPIPIDESYFDDSKSSLSNDIEFTQTVCRKWESSALSAQSDNTRVCIVAIGLVLGLSGGALPKMLPAFKLGLGGPIASGEQGMSWIHQQDLISLFVYLLEHGECRGVYNATSPNPVSNKDFSTSLGSALSRPAIIPMPSFVLNLVLGEMAELLTQGQYVIPKRALDDGFSFKYSKLDDAFSEIFSRK